MKHNLIFALMPAIFLSTCNTFAMKTSLTAPTKRASLSNIRTKKSIETPPTVDLNQSAPSVQPTPVQEALIEKSTPLAETIKKEEEKNAPILEEKPTELVAESFEKEQESKSEVEVTKLPATALKPITSEHRKGLFTTLWSYATGADHADEAIARLQRDKEIRPEELKQLKHNIDWGISSIAKNQESAMDLDGKKMQQLLQDINDSELSIGRLQKIILLAHAKNVAIDEDTLTQAFDLLVLKDQHDTGLLIKLQELILNRIKSRQETEKAIESVKLRRADLQGRSDKKIDHETMVLITQLSSQLQPK